MALIYLINFLFLIYFRVLFIIYFSNLLGVLTSYMKSYNLYMKTYENYRHTTTQRNNSVNLLITLSLTMVPPVSIAFQE